MPQLSPTRNLRRRRPLEILPDAYPSIPVHRSGGSHIENRRDFSIEFQPLLRQQIGNADGNPNPGQVVAVLGEFDSTAHAYIERQVARVRAEQVELVPAAVDTSNTVINLLRISYLSLCIQFSLRISAC